MMLIWIYFETFLESSTLLSRNCFMNMSVNMSLVEHKPQINLRTFDSLPEEVMAYVYMFSL